MRVLRTLLLVLVLVGLIVFNVSFGLRRFEWRRQAWQREVVSVVDARLDLAVVALEREAAAAEQLASWAAAQLGFATDDERSAPAADPPTREQRLLAALEPSADAQPLLTALAPLFAASPGLLRVELVGAGGQGRQVRRGADQALPTVVPLGPAVGQRPPGGSLSPAPQGRLEVCFTAPLGRVGESGASGQVTIVRDCQAPTGEAADDPTGARLGVGRDDDPLSTAPDVSGELADARLRRPLEGLPGVSVSAQIPRTALVPPRKWHRQETISTVLTMLGVTAGLLFVGTVFLRLSARSFRLHETERYLRWIRVLSDRYRALMEGAADMILIVDPADGSLREANAVARASLALPPGLDAPDVRPPGADTPQASRSTALTLADLFAGDQLPAVEQAVQRAMADPGAAQALPEVRVRSTAGGELVVDVRIAAVDVGTQHIVELSLRDLTRQREIERRLQTTERLQSLGLLTAGVAHEINNPLEGIGNYLALIQAGGVDDERRKEYLARVRHGFDRIRDIVRDLLHFSRPQVGSGPIDLSQVVERALSMASFSKVFVGVAVERRGLDAPLPVHGDAGRLEQVVLNLLLNAARATDGGTVHVSACTADADHGVSVELTVADDGPGIPADALDRVFDPFFTTEGGTGLGLSVSYGIVQAHGGTLTAANRPQGGAVFSLCLPVERAAEVSAEPGSVQPVQRGTEGAAAVPGTVQGGQR